MKGRNLEHPCFLPKCGAQQQIYAVKKENIAIVPSDTQKFAMRFLIPVLIKHNYYCRAAIGSENEDGSKKFVIRPYTPTSPKDAKGYFDLVVKVYEQGKMSKHFGELKVDAHPLCMHIAE